MIRHVRQLGGLMIAQGVLSCFVGFISLAIGPLNLIFFTRQQVNLPIAGKVIPWVYIVSGLLILTSGVLNVFAGVRIRKFQNRTLGIVALITNAIYMFSFFSLPCLPCALALMIFGLVVLFNQDVRRAFAVGLESLNTPETGVQTTPALQTGKRDWFGRNWKWLVPAIVLLPVLAVGCFGGCLFFGLQYGFKSSDVYANALSRVQTDPSTMAALGSPIEPGFMVSGNISGAGNIGHAELWFPISGPRGSGTVHLVGDKSAGKWEFKILEVTMDGANQHINLLEKG